MDPMVQLFITGRAHIYYACLGIIALSLAMAFGAPKELNVVVASLAGGVFADAWAHLYQH